MTKQKDMETSTLLIYKPYILAETEKSFTIKVWGNFGTGQDFETSVVLPKSQIEIKELSHRTDMVDWSIPEWLFNKKKSEVKDKIEIMCSKENHSMPTFNQIKDDYEGFATFHTNSF